MIEPKQRWRSALWKMVERVIALAQSMVKKHDGDDNGMCP